MTKPYAIIAGIILLLALGAGVWGWEKGLFSKETTPTPPVVTDDPYAGWQTYRNEEYGFEVKYPDRWSLTVGSRNEFDGTVIKIVSPETKENIAAKKIDYFCDWAVSYYPTVSDEPENKAGALDATTIEEMIDRNHMITKIGETELGGETATDVIWGGYGAYYSILSDHGNHLYIISSCNKESRDALTKIDKGVLASFKFLR